MKTKHKFFIYSQLFIIILALLGYLTYSSINPKTIQNNTFNANHQSENFLNIQLSNQNLDSKSLLLAIHQHIKNNQINKALLLTEKLYKSSPKSSISYLIASHLYLLKDQNQLAYENLIKAQKFQDFKQFNTQIDLQIALVLNDFVSFSNNIHKLNLQNPHDIIHLAVYYAKIQNFEELNQLFNSPLTQTNPVTQRLKDDYKYYLTFKDSNLNLLYNLWAKTLLQNQYIHYARSLLLDAIRSDSSSHNSYLLLSYCYILSENYQDPYNTNINFYLAFLNQKQKLPQKSLEHLQKIQNSQIYEVEIQKLLGLNYFELQQYDQASQHLENYLNNDPTNLNAYEKVLEINLIHNKDLNKAFNLLKKLESMNLNNEVYHHLIGSTYQKLQNLKQAKNSFTKALTIDEYHYPSLLHLALIYIQENQMQQANNALNKAYKSANIHGDKEYIQKIQQIIQTINN